MSGRRSRHSKPRAAPLARAGRPLLEHLLAAPSPPPFREIYVNRTLRMEGIRYVGFDLDWTLADYQRLPLEQLTLELTIDRLLDHNGYPEAIRSAEFRPDFPRRGLLIDKEAGTVLGMNRHRYVNLAYFGRDRLDREDLKRLYRAEPIQPASERFYHVDSLFELPEVNLFAELVELSKGTLDGRLPPFRTLFADIRAAIDWVHGGGALKQRVVADLPTYLHRDPEVALALQRLALGGRRLFLLTNSDWRYAQALCAHLFDGVLPGLDSWRQLFDLVIVDSGKPSFFRGGSDFVPLAENGEPGAPVAVPQWGGVYSGGDLEGFQRLIDAPGEQVLYVGDHIYGDIVSSKLGSTWRTALIARELESELARRQELAAELGRELGLQRQLVALGREMDHTRDVVRLAHQAVDAGDDQAAELLEVHLERLCKLEARHHRIMRQDARALDELGLHFNPYWGSFFKLGTSKTRFASQLETYACLYTSRVSNFAFYGTDHYFRVIHDPLVFELE